AVRRVLSDVGVNVWVESDADWVARIAAQSETENRLSRVRLVGASGSVERVRRTLADAVEGDPDLAIYANDVTIAGRLELLPFLREQAISITAHRFGNPDRWSEAVI
ncbi:MAG: hypothetical protein ABWY37_06190, partial [Microbacterium pygmaeum]